MIRTLRSVALAIVVACACGGQATTGGSETNWLGSCTVDADCENESCVCGVCTPECVSDGDCAAGAQRCATRGSAAFDALCESSAGTAGMCLRDCSADADCWGNERCTGGVCVPYVVSRPSVPRERGLGAPCVPGDAKRADFPGYSVSEISLETKSPSCDTGICLAHFFQGRVGCPYGLGCVTPTDPPLRVTVPVQPQLVARPAAKTVTCSCRCDGPREAGPFCACPSGFECVPAVPKYAVDRAPEDPSGSYCVGAGTNPDDPTVLEGGPVCDPDFRNCEDRI